MDIAVARHVLRATFRSSRELEYLIPLLKEACPPEEYDVLVRAIAGAIAENSLGVVNRILAAHPGLEAEVDADVARYGRYL